MKPRDDRSWEDRVAAMSDAIGGHADFDFEAIAAVEAVEALVKRWGAIGMTEELAGEIVPFVASNGGDDAARFGVMLREVLALIIYADNARLLAEEIRLAFGFRETNSESIRGIASRYGVTPQAISKQLLDLQQRLNLPKNTFNKSAAACAVYQTTNKARESL